jgi:hypothetical protein
LFSVLKHILKVLKFLLWEAGSPEPQVNVEGWLEPATLWRSYISHPYWKWRERMWLSARMRVCVVQSGNLDGSRSSVTFRKEENSWTFQNTENENTVSKFRLLGYKAV